MMPTVLEQNQVTKVTNTENCPYDEEYWSHCYKDLFISKLNPRYLSWKTGSWGLGIGSKMISSNVHMEYYWIVRFLMHKNRVLSPDMGNQYFQCGIGSKRFLDLEKMNNSIHTFKGTITFSF
jgi:hypothetical protein